MNAKVMAVLVFVVVLVLIFALIYLVHSNVNARLDGMMSYVIKVSNLPIMCSTSFAFCDYYTIPKGIM